MTNAVRFPALLGLLSQVQILIAINPEAGITWQKCSAEIIATGMKIP